MSLAVLPNLGHQIGAHPSFGQKAGRVFQKVKDTFNRIVPEKVQDGFSLGFDIAGKVTPVIESSFTFVYELIKPAEKTAKTIFHSEVFKKIALKVEEIVKVITKYRIIPLITAPFVVYDLAMKIHKFAKGIIKHNALNVMTDKTLALINSVFDMTSLVAAFVGNSVFGTVAGFLSVINIVIYGKSLYHNIKLYNDALKNIPDGQNPLDNIDKRDLKNLLDADKARAMITKVNDIWNDPNTTDAAKNEITKAFKKRAIQRIVSNALKLAASVINLVATVIFLAYPPAAPVVFGLYALSSLIYLAEFITNKVVERQWEKVIAKHQVAQ